LLKTLLISLLLFCIPVGLAVYLSPVLFENSKTTLDSAYSSYANTETNPVEVNDFKPELESSKSYIELDSDPVLEPNRNNLFIASITFSIPKEMEEGKAIKFFTKYNSDKRPYMGWGLRLKKIAGTIRPEVYWQGRRRKGGWLSFAEISLNKKQWNSITLIADKANSISLYYQNLESKKEDPKIQYLGGFSVDNISLPKNEGKLKFLHPISSNKKDEIVIFDFVLVNLKKEVKSINNLISKGASSLAKRVPYQEISLWIDARGKDRSHYNRKL